MMHISITVGDITVDTFSIQRDPRSFSEPCRGKRKTSICHTAGTKKGEKLVDKPGSVVDSHSSRPFITEWLKQPTRKLSEPPHRLPIWSCSEWGLPCQACHQDCGGLLPHLFTLTNILLAVYFLLHFPSPHGVWPLTSILLYGARTFLPI